MVPINTFMYSISYKKTFWYGPLVSSSNFPLISSRLSIQPLRPLSSNKSLIRSFDTSEGVFTSYASSALESFGCNSTSVLNNNSH
jgi:hypothetical protein